VREFSIGIRAAANGARAARRKQVSKRASPIETVLELPFKVDLISRSAAPAGTEGVWHSYVITQGTNTITGIRAGTHAEVAILLHDMIERLNERRSGKTRPRSKS
jgi:hypothetical protein